MLMYFVTFIYFVTILGRDILFWLSLWQLKEYRWDRLRVHLRETNQGKRSVMNWGVAARLVVLGFFGCSLIVEPLYSWLPLIAFLLLTALFLQTLQEVISRRMKRPKKTLKALTIIGMTIFLYGVVFMFFPLNWYAFLIFLDMSVPLIVAIFVLLTTIPSKIYYKRVINKAIEVLNNRPDIQVIGITGCYGKGSTKEFLSAILGEKFVITKTIGTFNTPIGIAQSILSEIKDTTEIFIVEMGGYKRGEIQEICDMVHPTIGIITPVEDQHLSLYGSEQELLDTTYELVEAIPEDGLIIFDGNSERTHLLYERTTKKKILCKVETEENIGLQTDIMAKNVKLHYFSVSFDVVLNKRNLGQFSANILGRHHIENILPGIYLGRYLGMSVAQIHEGMKHIKHIDATLEPITLPNGTVLVNDTHNASMGSVIAAVNYMSLYKGKRVMVLHPLIELGDHAVSDHQVIGKYLGEFCTHLFLTNDNFLQEIKEGLSQTKGKCEVEVADAKIIAEFVNEKCKKNDVIVFEGREAMSALLLIK